MATLSALVGPDRIEYAKRQAVVTFAFVAAPQVADLVGHNGFDGFATEDALTVEFAAVQVHLQEKRIIEGGTRQACAAGEKCFGAFYGVFRVVKSNREMLPLSAIGRALYFHQTGSF